MIDVVVERVRRHQTAISIAILALLAYVPALTASPGRMPTDSKLYVYLDPGRFLADTTTTFDPRQFGGWVPHQHIAYLWPTGPWFWFFETLGVPDWIAHRLWVGTLLFAAGMGVRWMSRVLGFNPLAALVAALVYQLSPYVLPYVSRTSVLLLPFAGLGWIVGLTILASWRGRWRHPAAIALVVLTVGAVNATALAMVIPAPVLWLVHAAWQRSITWRRAAATAAKTAVLCLGVSLWWVMMLVIQGRYGADVLAYSESLEAVSFTSTSTEVSRGLGYWLFYVRDAYAAATTSSIDHLVSGRTVLAGFLVVGFGLAGIVGRRWEHRRFAALLFGAGVILGVGVHPIDDPSPLMALLVGDGEGGLALALRSSTRAVPVMLLGLGLGAAALVSSAGDAVLWRRSNVSGVAVRVAAAGVVALVSIVALPALRNGGFVDEALERDQDPPAAWLEAAAALDAEPDGYRVLQVPGTEFGAFQWGYTVDQPLPGLTERPLVTRDLLPLGSPAAMDLVFALDDRFQTDTIEPEAVAAVSRFLGVDTIWVSGDVSFDRFRLARPEVVTDDLTNAAARDAGLGSATAFGVPQVMANVIPMIDNRSLSDQRIGEPIAPITLVEVDDPIPTVRVKDQMVVLAGSGDGVIDASAAGVLDGTEAVLYVGSLGEAAADADATSNADALGGDYRFVLTDSNRDRAHHWRSSQDVVGFTESAAAESDVLRFESADQRLEVFGEVDAVADSDEQTVSVQSGPVTARATSYGERFSYLPEHRPVMAIDGDPATSWLAADRFDPIGEYIDLQLSASIDHLELLQPQATDAQRTITQVLIRADDAAPFVVDLDERSRTGTGQRFDVVATGSVQIEIVATTSPMPAIGEAIGGVGFSEISTGLGPTTELIRTPIAGADEMAAASGVDIVLTRLRTEPTDRWRSDPEPTLARQFVLPEALDVNASVTLRLDQRLDDAALALLLGDQAVATTHLLGAPDTRGAMAFDGDDNTAWTTRFSQASGAAIGQSVTLRHDGTASTISIAQPGGDYSPITGLRITDSAGSIDIAIPTRSASEADPERAIDTSTVVFEVALDRAIDTSTVTFEITSVDERFTQNRRFNEPNVLPSAISEIFFDGAQLQIAPTPVVGESCTEGLLSIDGQPVGLSFESSTTEALGGSPIEATVCGDVSGMTLDAGQHTVTSASNTGFHVDRVVLSTAPTDEAAATTGSVDPTQTVVLESSSRSRTVEVPACPAGCWLVHGEGFSTGWTASTDGTSLGEPVLIDGNANGWWIEPSESSTVVEIGWSVQRNLNIAFLLSALAALISVALVLWDRRRGDDVDPFVIVSRERPDRRSDVAVALVAGFAAAVFVDWVWFVPAVALWALAIVLRRRWIVGVVGAAIIVGAGLIVTQVVRTEEPFPDASWPVRFEWLHVWTLFGVVLVASCGLADRFGHRPDVSPSMNPTGADIADDDIADGDEQ